MLKKILINNPNDDDDDNLRVVLKITKSFYFHAKMNFIFVCLLLFIKFCH